MTDNPFWDLIQRYMDDPRHRYPPKAADIARECGLSAQLLSKWKLKPTLPEPEQLERLAAGTRISYPRLLEAALRGKGYFVAGPARIVTVDFLDRQDAENFDFEDERMPFARALGVVNQEMSEADDTLPAAAKEGQLEEPGE